MKKGYVLASSMLLTSLVACGGGAGDGASAPQAQGADRSAHALALAATTPPPVKWHPGHYGLSLNFYTPSADQIRQIHADWAAVLGSTAKDAPGFVGVNAFYNWYHLENGQGNYNFKPIDDDIKWLNDNFPGKKLIIEIWSRDFTTRQALPTTPQNAYDQNSRIPDYIVDGKFDGSNGQSGVTWNQNGRIAAFWSPAVLQRLQALDQALAAHLDGNPTVEVIKYDEYAPPAPSTGAPQLGWSRDNVIGAWNALHTSMAAHWPTTNKVLMANWPNNSSGSPDTAIIPFAKGIAVGVGGPDVLPRRSDGTGETWGAQLLYGALGNTDYRGTIPVVYEAENPAWKIAVPDLEDYAYTTLHATHLAWLYNPTNIGAATTTGKWQPGIGMTPWRSTSTYTGVLDALIANRFRIHAACPTAYAGGCRTD